MCVDKELSILGENIKLVSVEGYLAWSGKMKKGQRRRLAKENQKTDIGLFKSPMYHGQKFEFHS